MRCEDRFFETYGRDYDGIAFCPYRICPIGAHSDHNLGKITGLAIDKGIHIVYAAKQNGVVEMSSIQFPKRAQWHIENVPPRKEGDWADYLRGATLSLEREHRLKVGICGVIEGTLPIGGLSVGKLDQSCEVLSQAHHLLYLDTKDGQYELIPEHPDMKPYKIAIFFSGLEHSLAGSKYNMRVDELRSGVYALQAFAGMEYGKFKDAMARNVPREVYETYKDRLPVPWRKRCEHWYTEFERVEKGAEAWRRGDIETYGRLSFESGWSSIHNWESGAPEQIRLYEIMTQTEGIYGGRFSGAGFKGCCMALIDPAFADAIADQVTAAYLKDFPRLADKYGVYICDSADGLNL